ncbi:MAG: hypothetical protein ABT10_23925 [Novosphingobium sp. SCN 63-17]|nr:MAG: hypothetical protein ABT10_23925 [Novosphingobium sp. SCN 63-17]
MATCFQGANFLHRRGVDFSHLSRTLERDEKVPICGQANLIRAIAILKVQTPDHLLLRDVKFEKLIVG